MKLTRRGIFGVIAAAVFGRTAVAAPAKKIWWRYGVDAIGPYWNKLDSCRYLKKGDLFRIENDPNFDPAMMFRADSQPDDCNDATGDWGIYYYQVDGNGSRVFE